VADRSVSVLLKANVTGLVAGFKTAGQAAQDFGTKGLDAVGRNEQHIQTLTTGVGALGLAMVGAAALAVKKFADFDQAMSNVAATGQDARDSIDLLRVAAIDAGKRTVFSASEAANAIEELGKAGVSAADILGGGLNGSLDLAAAGGIGVAEAAGIAAIALKQFGLKGSDMTHVSDLLAAGAGKAMGGVSDLGMALKQAGLVANQTGLTIEETTAGLSAFASAGMIGSDAGTSFKSMLQRLTPQSAEAQKAMDALGISAYDSQGKFIGLAEFAGNLQTSMKDLTPEARGAAMSVIFGSDAVRAASVLYNEGSAGIEKWTAAVNDQGYAAITAATRLNNLKGDIEQLSGSVETMLINFGSGADGPLRSLTQGLTSVVNQLADMSPAAQTATLGIVGGGGLVLLGVAGLGKLVVGVNEAKIAMTALGISAKTATLAVVGIGAVLGIGAMILSDWSSQQAEARRKAEALTETLDKQTGAITGSTRAWVADDLIKSGAAKTYKDLGGNVADLADAAFGASDAMARVNDVLSQPIPNESQQMITGLFTGDTTMKRINSVRDSLGGMKTALADGTTEWQLNADMAGTASDAQGTAADSYAQTTGAITDQTDALADLIKAQSEAAGVVLSERDAQRALEASVDDAAAALKENGQTLDITTAAGRANQSALDDVAKSGWDLIAAMKANGSSQAEIQATMQTSRDKFLGVADSMGIGTADAKRLADQLGLIPASVVSRVQVDTEAAQAALDAWIRGNASHRINVAVGAGGSGGITKATGGRITGPGTGTSDSIPLWGSNGEYMVKAQAVSHYGPAMFDSLNAMRFAGGGQVGGSPMTATITQPGGTVHNWKLYTNDPEAMFHSFTRRLNQGAAV